MVNFNIQAVRCVVAGILISGMLASCTTGSAQGRRMARWRPDAAGRDAGEWFVAAQNYDTAVTQNATDPQETAAVPANTASVGEERKMLKNGDKIEVHLSGIPNPYDIVDIIDDTGMINLPFVDAILLAGKTTAEAENEIERAYVDGGYYRKISVTVVAEMDEFFMRGEVKLAGRYPLTSGLTLLQAIATAGGYTDFAKRNEVRVIRNNDILVYDAEKIEAGTEKAPLIKSGDIIVVQRRRW